MNCGEGTGRGSSDSKAGWMPVLVLRTEKLGERERKGSISLVG